MRSFPTKILAQAKSAALVGCLAAGGSAPLAPAQAAAQTVVAFFVPGDGAAPVAMIQPVPAVGRVAAPEMQAYPAAIASPFAMMQRMVAEMDREQAAMLRMAASMDSMAAPVGGANFCSQVVQITYTGGQPRVIEHTSGNCGPALRAVPTRLAPRAPASMAHTVLARNDSRPAYERMVRPAVELSER